MPSFNKKRGVIRFSDTGEGGADQSDLLYSLTSLICNFEGANGATSTTDASPIGHSITFNGDAQISTARAAEGSSSVLFDGTGDYLTIADAASLQLSGDFTIEFQFYPEDGPSVAQSVVYVQDGLTYVAQAFLWTGTNLVFYSSSNGSTWDIANAVLVASSLSTGAWSGHVAVTRTDNTYSTYHNGSRTSTFTNSSTPISGYSTSVGARPNGNNLFQGNVDQLRITKGAARYTGASYIVPTGLFPTS